MNRNNIFAHFSLTFASVVGLIIFSVISPYIFPDERDQITTSAVQTDICIAENGRWQQHVTGQAASLTHIVYTIDADLRVEFVDLPDSITVIHFQPVESTYANGYGAVHINYLNRDRTYYTLSRCFGSCDTYNRTWQTKHEMDLSKITLEQFGGKRIFFQHDNGYYSEDLRLPKQPKLGEPLELGTYLVPVVFDKQFVTEKNYKRCI